MRVLLDTHTFLWFVMGSAKLSDNARTLIEDPANDKVLSVASLWEMAIKVSLGKLTLSPSFDDLIPSQLSQNGIGLLNIKVDHLSLLATLLFHHRDPFDRLLIAQAVIEKIPVVGF
jgi:PIN domain nuclease of toxin-antitoxin system